MMSNSVRVWDELMMGQILLLTYSYIVILLFFWALLLALSFGQMLRESRMARQELLVFVSPNKNVSSKHLLAYVPSPLDEMQAWHSKPEKAEQRLGQTMLPMRYRQTLLFADDLAETTPNPVTKNP